MENEFAWARLRFLRGDVWIKENFVFSFLVKKNLSSMEGRTIFDNIDVLCDALETWKALRKSSACGIRLMPQRCSLEPPILSFFPFAFLPFNFGNNFFLSI